MKLLLADDNEVARRVLEHALARAGHDVVAVADGSAAVAAYERDRPPIAILDWEMPVVDGLEASRQIRAAAGGAFVFVLMLTGRQGPGDLVSALNAGVDDYIVKPATPEHLAARLLIAERRILLETARREMEAALARSRWLAGVGETALALQHEINNPLTALIGETQLLELEELPASLGDSVAAIGGAARRIADVVKRLSELKDPQSVHYAQGAQMLDLAPPPGRPAKR